MSLFYMAIFCFLISFALSKWKNDCLGEYIYANTPANSGNTGYVPTGAVSNVLNQVYALLGLGTKLTSSAPPSMFPSGTFIFDDAVCNIDFRVMDYISAIFIWTGVILMLACSYKCCNTKKVHGHN